MVYFVTKTTAEYSNFQLGENYRFALFCLVYLPMVLILIF